MEFLYFVDEDKILEVHKLIDFKGSVPGSITAKDIKVLTAPEEDTLVTSPDTINFPCPAITNAFTALNSKIGESTSILFDI